MIEIEKNMSPGLFTAYTGYKYMFNEAPADYSEVYIYADAMEVERRFPPRRGKPNVFVLKQDEHLLKFKRIPIAQLYVDLWNLDTWYAHEYLKCLEEKINGILERIGP